MEDPVSLAWADFDSLRNATTPPKVDFYPQYICTFCGGHKTTSDAVNNWAEFTLPTCTDCGRVDEYDVSEEPEWRTGGDHEGPDPSRVGAPMNTDHFSEAWNLGTIMRTQRNATYEQKRQARINFHNSMNHRDRSLFHAYQEFERIAKGILGLPDSVIYSAKIKYRTFTEAVLTRGAVRHGIKANCIYQACKEAGVARTAQEIASAFDIPAKDLSRTFEIYQEQVPETVNHVTGPEDIIPRFFSAIQCIPEKERGRVKCKCIKAAEVLDDSVALMGRTPKSIAAAIIFIVVNQMGYKISKQEVCQLCDVSGPTLNKIENIVKQELALNLK